MIKATATNNTFTVCGYFLRNISCAGDLFGEALRLLADSLRQDAAAMVGNVSYSHHSPSPSGFESGRCPRAEIARELAQIQRQSEMWLLIGEVWIPPEKRSARRPRHPPVTFYYQEAEPTRADYGQHGIASFAFSTDLLRELPWARVHELLRKLVMLFEQHMQGTISLFVELANASKHAGGAAYGSTIDPHEDLQFCTEHMLWRSGPLDQQLKIRGVFWGTYLSPAHLRAIREPENLPKRLARWYGGTDTPRSTVSCWNTPGGGLLIETSPTPCDWPLSDPITYDPSGVRTIYNELHRAGFFDWKSGIMRS
jgi:hypothetical protein